jgi:hypothetical protein
MPEFVFDHRSHAILTYLQSSGTFTRMSGEICARCCWRLPSAAWRNAADTDRRTLARRWCATCHVVAANQRPTGEAPIRVAKRSDFNGRLATF